MHFSSLSFEDVEYARVFVSKSQFFTLRKYLFVVDSDILEPLT